MQREWGEKKKGREEGREREEREWGEKKKGREKGRGKEREEREGVKVGEGRGERREKGKEWRRERENRRVKVVHFGGFILFLVKYNTIKTMLKNNPKKQKTKMNQTERELLLGQCIQAYEWKRKFQALKFKKLPDS